MSGLLSVWTTTSFLFFPYGDRYSWNCSVTAHLRARNSCLLVIPLLCLSHNVAGISNRMVSSIRLLLQQHSSQALAGGIRFQQEGLPKLGKAKMGAWRHAALRRSKASRASCGKSRCSDFLSLFLPLVKSYRGAVILANPLIKCL